MSNKSFEDVERRNFELWLRSQPHVLNVGRYPISGEYILEEDENQWLGWLACARLRSNCNEAWDEIKHYRDTLSGLTQKKS